MTAAGLVISVIGGFVAGYFIYGGLCKKKIKRWQEIIGAGLMAFMHGAQDGQKFMGVFLLGAFIAKGQMGVTEFEVPIWLMVLCSVIMALGTSIGGYKIIKSVGMGMVKLETYQGFAADLAAAVCLMIASVTGIPVSTTHTKTTAIMGVGASKRLSAVNWKVVGEMVLAWVLTFPGCGILGFVMVKIFGLF
jgi:PiT family inorganic phosphate transporter